jgi:hypothetical protein
VRVWVGGWVGKTFVLDVYTSVLDVLCCFR